MGQMTKMSQQKKLALK